MISGPRSIGAYLALPALAAVFFCGCDGTASSPKSVFGSGNVVSEARPVGAFSGIVLSGIGSLVADRGSSEALTVRAEDNILPLIVSETRGGVLFLEIVEDTPISTEAGIEHRLTYRTLDAVTVSGTTRTTVRGIDTSSFSLSGSGVTTVLATGSAETQSINLSGTSLYFAEDLTSRVVTISITGQSHALVRASERLNVVASGSSVVEYIGDPVLNISTSGLATVKRR